MKRHPVRGLLWGLLAGVGIVLMLVDRAIIAVGTLSPLLVVVVVGLLGLGWAFVAPARKPKEAPGQN